MQKMRASKYPTKKTQPPKTLHSHPGDHALSTGSQTPEKNKYNRKETFIQSKNRTEDARYYGHSIQITPGKLITDMNISAGISSQIWKYKLLI